MPAFEDDEPPPQPDELYLTIRGTPSAPSPGATPAPAAPVGPTPSPRARDFFPTPGREGDRRWAPPTAPRPLPLPPAATPPQADRYFPPSDDPLAVALRQMKASPAEARAIADLQSQTGLPASTIQRHQTEIRQGLAATNFDPLAFRQRTPKLAQWLTEHPERVPAVQDDLPALQQVEDAVTFGESVVNGIDQWRGGFGAFLEAGAELLPAEWGPTETGLGAFGKRERIEAEARTKARGQGQPFSGIRGVGDLYDWGKQQVGSQIPIMGSMMGSAYAGAAIGTVVLGPGIGTTIGAAVGAFLPALVLGVGEVQSTIKQIDPDAVASKSVWLGGSAIAAFDTALPGHVGARLVRTFGREAAEDIAKRALLSTVKPTMWAVGRKGAITGLKEEVVPEILQEAIGAYAAAKGTGTPLPEDLPWQLLEAGASAALVGPLGSAGVDMATIRRQQRNWAVAEQQYAWAQQQKLAFEALGTGVTDSKLLKDLPQGMAEFLQSALAEGPIPNVFIPTEPFAEYWTKQGLNPDLVAEQLTGSRTALADARRDGIDLVVPTATYATKIAATADHAFFLAELRLRENIRNLREVEADLKETTEAAAAAEAEALQAVPAERLARLEEARAAVYARVEAQAKAGGASPRVAASWAQLEATAFVRMAARLEIDPFALLAQRGVPDIVTPLTPPAGAGVAGQTGPASIPPSPATPNETRAQRDTRRSAQVAALTSALLRAARAIDPGVTEADIRDELAFRLAYDEDRQQATRESGTGQGLLRAMAQAGGLWHERTGHYQGEVRDLMEMGRDIRDTRAGRVLPLLGRATYAGVPGVFAEGGKHPEAMLRALQADPEGRFAHLETIADLLDAVDAAFRAAPDQDVFPGTAELATIGIDPATRWWEDPWRPMPEAAPEVEGEDGLEGDAVDQGGDTSFEFFQLTPENTPKGYGVIAPHLTPAEKLTLRRDTAQRLVDIFKSLPADIDFAEAAQAGIAKKGWYERSRAAIEAVFGPVDSVRFTALLAALSPQTSVPTNLTNTLLVWSAWIAAGRPQDAKSIKRILARALPKAVRKPGEPKSKGVLPSWVNNSVRALRAEDPLRIVLSGPKVQSFAMNLWGYLQEVTNDAWMANFALVDQAIFGGSLQTGGTDPGKGPGYRAMSAKIRRVAKYLTATTGEEWTPAHVQETVWSWARTLYELAEAQGTSAVALLQSGGLTDAAIGGTPDFAGLFTQDASVRSLLEAAGYGDVLSTLTATLSEDARGGDGGAGAAGAGAGGASRPITPALLRSARRLDRLRVQRAADKAVRVASGQTPAAKKAAAARASARAARIRQRGGEFRQEAESSSWHDPAFYSRLTLAVQASTLQRATGAQWKATIRNSKTGIAQDEFVYAHVEDLEDARTYTRQEVLDYLAANQLVLQYVTLREARPPTAAAIDAKADQRYQRALDAQILWLQTHAGYEIPVTTAEARYDEEAEAWAPVVTVATGLMQDVGEWYASEAQALAAAQYEAARQVQEAEREVRAQAARDVDYDVIRQQVAEDLQQGTENDREGLRYGQWQMPGPREPGSAREVFLTAPAVRPGESGLPGLSEAEADELRGLGFPLTVRDIAQSVADADRDGALQQVQIALEQTEELTLVDAEAERQRARSLELLRQLEHHLTTQWRAPAPGWRDGHQLYEDVENPIVRLRYNIRTLADGRRMLFLEELQPPYPEEFAKMPRLLQKQWRELGLKWAIATAAELKLDLVGWTPGSVQVDRYALRKHIDEIRYEKQATGRYAFSAWKEGNSLDRVERLNATLEDVAEMFGPDIAKRIAANEGALRTNETKDRLRERGRAVEVFQTDEGDWQVRFEHGAVMGVWSTEQGARSDMERMNAALDAEPERVLTGADLAVGGQGLQRLYDKDLPAVANSLPVVKRNGSRVGTVEVPAAGPVTRVYRGPEVTAAQLRADIEASLDARLDGRPPHPWTSATRLDAQTVLSQMADGVSFAAAMGATGSLDLAEHYDGWIDHQEGAIEVPALPVTPGMVAEIGGKGQALFQTEGPPTEGPGVVRGGYNPETNVIRLTQAANLSTFLHEAGHQFLEDLLFADTLLPAPEAQSAGQQGLAADVRTALKALGFQGTPEEWRTLDVEARRTYHEHFADAFLVYLEEGTAPDPELRTLFRRFREWLSQFIQGVTARGISVSPELRGVFDRLLASDEAIARAQAEAQVHPLLTDAASAGVSPEVFAAYQAQVAEASARAREEVDQAVMAQWRREQRADWQEQRLQVRAAVAEEFNSRPAFVAQSVIRTGKMPDGSLPANGDGQPMKLSKADLVRSFGPGILAKLPKPYLYSLEGGIPVETAAELFGFGSGESLIEALQVTPPTQRAIEAETDARMREQLGAEPLEGPALDAVAERAVHQHRAAVISAELAALTQGMAGVTLTPLAQLKAAAEARVQDMTVGAIKPGLYLEAVRRASQQAFNAWAKNDRVAAIAAKQREQTALAMYRAMRDAQARVAVQTRLLQKHRDHQPTRARIGKAGGDYLDQIDALLDRYGFGQMSGPARQRTVALRKWIAKLEAQGLPLDLPEDVVDDARTINYRELTVGHLEALADTVRMIAHLARTKNRLLASARARTLEEVTSELATSAREHGKVRPKTHEPRLPGPQQVLKFFRGLNIAHRKLAHIAYALDGYQWGGPFWTYIINPLNQASNASTVMNSEATVQGHALFGRYSLEERRHWFTKLHLPALGPVTDASASLTKQARLLVALNWGNETNRQRVRDGHGWTEAQAQAILDTLDRKDWEFVQGMWDWINTYWPLIAEKQARVTGLAPEKVQATPVFTKYGEFPGGYFPIKFEGELAAAPGSHEEGGVADLAKLAAYVSSTTARNHVKRRAEGDVTIPVRLDFGVVQEHIGQVIHDLTHHEVLLDVGRLLRDEGVQQAIYDVAGRETYDAFKNALRDIAVGDVGARNTVEQTVNHVRAGVTVVGLGFNVVNTLINLLGVTQSWKRIGLPWMTKGLTSWLGTPAHMKRVVEEVHARSALMRHRDTTQSRDIRDVLTDVGLKRGPVSLWVDQVLGTISADKLTKQAIVESYFRLQQYTQLMVDVVTFLAAEQKALADPTTVKDDGTLDIERAVALADQEVINSQGSGSIKDLAAIQRGGPWLKLYTTFYFFFSSTYNNWADSIGKGRYLWRHGRKVEGVTEVLAGYALVILIPAVLNSIFLNLLRGEDDEDEFVTDAILATGAYMMGTMVLLRELGGAVQGYLNYEGPAGLRSLGDLSAVIRAMVTGKGTQQAVEKGLKLVGTIAHLPVGQAWRSYEGFLALLEGRTENPLALITGPPPREKARGRRDQ